MSRVRLAALVVLLATVAAIAAPPADSTAKVSQSSLVALDLGVLDQLNAIRDEHGLEPLRLNRELSTAALRHTLEMGRDGYFRHASFDGTAFWRRIDRWYPSTGFGYWAVGENLLWSAPGIDSVRALQLWMSSPEHRANILASRWREIGIAAVHLPAAPGTYRGREVTIITTDFGVRR